MNGCMYGGGEEGRRYRASKRKEDTRAVLILFGSSGRTQRGPLGCPCTGTLSSCISSKSAISSRALKLAVSVGSEPNDLPGALLGPNPGLSYS